ncbi:hypothetical protein ACLSSQ_11710 [Azospira sp. APE16]|uniref:hypothetical protein n=1 Tax=Azospira sp. APE16 TaxID=3394231 RepID=UPI003A4E446B
MTTEKKDPLGIGHWPRWKQVAFFFLAVTILMAGFGWVAQAVELRAGSPQARKLKAKIEPLAVQLEHAQKVGDRQAVTALYEPVTKIVNDYNALDDAKRNEVNNSPLRYCLLASMHLGDGVGEVLKSGHWLKKDQFQNALDACK